MTPTRILRRLAAWRSRLRRPSSGCPALPGLYDRALLFGGGAVLTLSILAAAAVGIAHRFERCIDDWRTEFFVQRDFVNASVERNQARMRHMVETYEALSRVHERDAVPVERYRRLLAENGGIVVTEGDIGVAPFTILSTLTAPEDAPRLAALLRLVREISPGSLLRQQGAVDDIGGFVYTEDRRFLAAWPPLSRVRLSGGEGSGEAEAGNKHSEGSNGRDSHRSGTSTGNAGGVSAAVPIEKLIDRFVANVDAELRKRPDALLRHERVFWVALYDSQMYGTLVKHYAAPIYRGEARMAVLAVTLPARQIPRLFQPDVQDPDFFIVSRDRRHLLGIDAANPRTERWMRALHASPSVFDAADERVRLVRRGRDFFLIQRIAGPDWTAVSAFDWRTIAANLGKPVSWALALTSVVLAVQWGFILLIDRLVLAPLRLRARRVFESEAFSRTVLATAPVGLAVFEPSTRRLVMQNGIARALLPASANEAGFYQRLLDARLRKRRRARAGALSGSRPGSGAGRRMVSRMSSIDIPGSVELALEGADGRRRELAVAFAQARYRAREVVLCSFTDISRQKETLRLMRRARQAADEASRAKSMLVATISHEIRTPLYGALGNLELLSMEALTPSQAARVSSVRCAFDNLLSLVDSVLDISKAEAHELQLRSERFRLDEVIERCAQTLAPAATSKGLRFLCLVDPSIGGVWLGDGLRIGQVLTNLLGNACKFTQSGSIVVRATAAHGADGGDCVTLSVADSGIGIPANRQTRIFEPFMQADGSISRRFGGTGLGLSLSQRLVELMGGRIELQSAHGRGAVFTVRLPLLRDRMQLRAAGEANQANQANQADNLAFDTIVVAAPHRGWQAVLLAQLRCRFGASACVVAARTDQPVAPPGDRAIVVLGSHVDEIPAAWRALAGCYLDVLVVSERGPLHPQRRPGALHVTSLCAAKLELAVAACGRDGEVPADAAALPQRPRVRAALHEASVLVVDDDPVSRALLADQLDAIGCRNVGVAGDGREALAACLLHRYDLVVADLSMPGMDGRALLEALRGKGMAMPVIAHTAAPCTIGDARRKGFAALLYKPISLDRLREELDAVLGDAVPWQASGCAAATTGVARPPSKEKLVGEPAHPAASLRAVFAATWPEDEQRLLAAWQTADCEAFACALHRLNGALLALGERQASLRCSQLREGVQARGMGALGRTFEELRRDIERIAELGRCHDSGQ